MAAAKKAMRATRLPATTRAPSLWELVEVRPWLNEVLPEPLDEDEDDEPVAALLPAELAELALESPEAVSPRFPPPLTPGTVSTSAVEELALEAVLVPVALAELEAVGSFFGLSPVA